MAPFHSVMDPLREEFGEQGTGIRERAGVQDERLRRLRRVVRLLDTAFEIPGTRWRVGLDALVGLLPGVGDLVTTAVSVWIVREARILGVRRRTRLRMAWNIAFDLLAGAVPLAGDVFDAVWKSNVRNLELIERDLARRSRRPRETEADRIGARTRNEGA